MEAINGGANNRNTVQGTFEDLSEEEKTRALLQFLQYHQQQEQENETKRFREMIQGGSRDSEASGSGQDQPVETPDEKAVEESLKVWYGLSGSGSLVPGRTFLCLIFVALIQRHAVTFWLLWSATSRIVVYSRKVLEDERLNIKMTQRKTQLVENCQRRKFCGEGKRISDRNSSTQLSPKKSFQIYCDKSNFNLSDGDQDLSVNWSRNMYVQLYTFNVHLNNPWRDTR